MRLAAAAARCTVPCFDGVGALVTPEAGERDVAALDVHTITALFRFTGLVMFRGFDLSTSGFKTLSGRLCRDFMTYEGGASARAIVDDEPTIMTVTEPSRTLAIPLHGEMYYTKHRPAILWFYCAHPAARDGETTVAEGSAVLELLSPQTRHLFATRAIRYICTYPDGRWQQLFHADDFDGVLRYAEANDMSARIDARDRTVVTEYTSRAIGESRFGGKAVFVNNVFAMTRWEVLGFRHRVVRLDDGKPLPAAVVDELQAVEAAAARSVSWQAGDVLMVDNTRFLHGRRAFTDLRREIYVRLCGGLTADK